LTAALPSSPDEATLPIGPAELDEAAEAAGNGTARRPELAIPPQCSRFARMIELHLARGDFVTAHSTIEWAQQVLQPPVEVASADYAQRSMSVTDLPIPRNVVHILEDNGITTVGDLIELTGVELRRRTNITLKSRSQIELALDAWGLSLAKRRSMLPTRAELAQPSIPRRVAYRHRVTNTRPDPD
jgi:hypothetical protein